MYLTSKITSHQSLQPSVPAPLLVKYVSSDTYYYNYHPAMHLFTYDPNTIFQVIFELLEKIYIPK